MSIIMQPKFEYKSIFTTCTEIAPSIVSQRQELLWRPWKINLYWIWPTLWCELDHDKRDEKFPRVDTEFRRLIVKQRESIYQFLTTCPYNYSAYKAFIYMFTNVLWGSYCNSYKEKLETDKRRNNCPRSQIYISEMRYELRPIRFQYLYFFLFFPYLIIWFCHAFWYVKMVMNNSNIYALTLKI